MAGSVTISANASVPQSQDYALLRARGMEILHKVASETWTDHNLHDPGITMLEVLCYAITEAGFKAGMDIADLVESGKSIAAPEFYTAAKVLPVMPVSASDLRKVLMDHPLLRNVWVSYPEVMPGGRIDVLMEFADDEINAFSFTETVNIPASSYLVQVTFPGWDEKEIAPLYDGAPLQSAVFDSGTWNPIEGSDMWFRRVLLDYQPPVGPVQTTPVWVIVHVVTPMSDPATELPQILAATGVLILTSGDNSAADQTLLKRYQRRVMAAYQATRQVSRYLQDYRNLGEYLQEFRSVRLQEIAFSATIDVLPATQIEDFLARVFVEVDRMIAPPLEFLKLDQFQDISAEMVYDGPLPDHGFLNAESKALATLPSRIYSSDILRVIFQQGGEDGSDVEHLNAGHRSVISVRNLRLSNFLDGRSITQDARDCLRLVDSKRHIPRFSPQKCKVFLLRNGVEVSYDVERVLELFTEQFASGQQLTELQINDIAPPTGSAYAVSDYYPVQNDLPLAYGVGEAGLPEHATQGRRALAKQLKGYLFLVEQLLSGYVKQLENVNRMFSSDPDLSTTVFHQPLYHLPGVSDLLKSFDAVSGTWENFVADPENEYIGVLNTAGESEDDFLDRRNRMLDHLLARFGEHMDDLTAHVLRQSLQIHNAGILTLPQLLVKQKERRRNAMRQMIGLKSEFYKALPDLQRRRLQAFGNPLWHHVKGRLTFHEDVSGVSWIFHDTDGQPVLRGMPSAKERSAARAAERIVAFATQESHYNVVVDGAQQRLMLNAHDSEPLVAHSVQGFPDIPTAQSAISGIAQMVRAFWTEYALSAFESRLYHLLPVRRQKRETLLHEIVEFFEIVNDPGGGVLNEKIFRLWSLPGFAGDQLLLSAGNFPGATDPIAIENARNGAREVMRCGLLHGAYEIQGSEPALQIVLHDEGGNIIALTPSVFTTRDLALAEITRIASHLYRFYSAEGFYLIEHVLLYADTGVFLVIPSAGQDPYTFQISIAIPSGYRRDFATGIRTPDQPAHYRDQEFRLHAENMMRAACPAHLLPRVYWVDRAIDGVALTGNEPCYDLFETRYRDWLDAFFTDDVAPSVIDPLRNALVEILNVIVADAESIP